MHVESIGPAVPVQVVCDGYVPLVIRMNGNSSWPPKYWRTGDFKHSLVEIAVDPTTGAVCKVVVTSIQDISSEIQLTNDAPHESGVPNVSLTAWQGDKTRVDVEGKVLGRLSGQTFTVVLCENQTTFDLVACDRVRFLLNSDKRLCGFQVVDLSAEEIDNLRYAIGA